MYVTINEIKEKREQISKLQLYFTANGMVISGSLKDEDRNTPYHNSANLSFSPYIVDPFETYNQTSRALQNRL